MMHERHVCLHCTYIHVPDQSHAKWHSRFTVNSLFLQHSSHKRCCPTLLCSAVDMAPGQLGLNVAMDLRVPGAKNIRLVAELAWHS